jgi:uncharacterized protein YhfF
MNSAVQQFWFKFLAVFPDIEPATPFQVWHFGNTREMALELAELVVSGVKTATASLAEVNEVKPDEAPLMDGYSVVTDIDGDPKCVIRTTELRHIPFDEVDARFAYDEGEGDRTLQYWRDVHEKYFIAEASEMGFDFNEKTIVCCERFELLYPR